MVIVERKNGTIKLRGRGKGEWMLVHFWPCSARTIRKLARQDLPLAWINEVAAFADEQMGEHLAEVGF